jgi:TetR/AcrR family transcriptional regulator, ethionamide resistance regulator
VSASVEALEPRNATEDAILAAARQALVEESYDRLTMDGIARRAHVSRTAVYFYFPNKRAVVDRLIQQAFSDMYEASSPYLDGDGEPRLQLRLGLARMVSCVNSHGPVLLLAAHLSGREDRLPTEWEPYIRRFIVSADRRIRRDQQRGIAPADVSPRISAQALCAMVERHITIEVIGGGVDVTETIRVLAELWYRAVYCTSPHAPAS